MKRNVKLKQIKLTRQEWNDALKVPLPHRDKSKYYRKEKHKNSGSKFGYHNYSSYIHVLI